MRILLLLLTLFLVSAQADIYFPVNTPDRADILADVLQSITYFTDTDQVDTNSVSGAQYFFNILYYVSVIGIAYLTLQLGFSAMNGDLTGGIKRYLIYLISIVFIQMLIYGPRDRAIIQTYSGTNYSIVEVNYFMGHIISAFLGFRNMIGSMADDAYNIPDPSDNIMSGGTNGLGYYGAQSALNRLPLSARLSNGTDKELPLLFNAYVKDCILLPLQANGSVGSGANTYTEAELLDSEQITAVLGSVASDSEFVTYAGNTYTCKAFYENNASVSPPGLAFQDRLGNYSQRIDVNGSKSGSALAYITTLYTDSNSALASASSVREAVMQATLSNAFNRSFAALGVSGQVASSAAAQSIADMQYQGMTSAVYYADQIPRLSFLMFVIMVAATPFMFIFLMFPGTFTILKNFTQTLVWVTMWEPMASILGIFQDRYLADQYRAMNIDTFNDILRITPSNLIDISSEAGTMAGMAGMMFVMIQGLSWLLINGSGVQMGNLLGSIASNFKQFNSGDAQAQTAAMHEERAMLSEAFGKQIGMREMLTYKARAGAANFAAETVGLMNTFGQESQGAAVAMTTSGAVRSTLAHSKDRAFSNRITSDFAKTAGEILGAEDAGATTGKTNTYRNTDTAAKMTENKVTQETSSNIAQYTASPTYTYNDIGTEKGTWRHFSDFGEMARYIDKHGNLDIAKIASTGIFNADFKATQDIQNAEQLAAMSGKGKEEVAQLNARMQFMSKKGQIEAVKDFYNVDADGATAIIASMSGLNSAIQTAKTFTDTDGMSKQEIRNAVETQNAQRSDSLQATHQVNESIDKKQNDLKEQLANNQKEQKTVQKQLNASQNRNISPEAKQLFSELHDTREKYNAMVKGGVKADNAVEFAAVAKELNRLETQTNGAESPEEYTTNQRKENNNNEVQGELQALSKEMNEVYINPANKNINGEFTPEAKKKIESIKAKQSALADQRESKNEDVDNDVKQMHDLQKKIEALHQEEEHIKKKIEQTNTVERAQQALIDYNASNTEANIGFVEYLEKKGMTPSEIKKIQAMQQAQDGFAQANALPLLGKALAKAFEGTDALDRVQEAAKGDDAIYQRIKNGTAEDSDYAQLTRDAKGLENNQIKTIVDGTKLTMSVTNDGEARASTLDSSSTFNAGTHFNVNHMDSIAGMFGSAYQSQTEIMVRSGVSKALNFVTSIPIKAAGEAAKRALTDKIKSSTKNIGGH